MQHVREVALEYFYAWQKRDWDTIRACLADHFTMDAGMMRFTHADEFTEFCKKGPTWSNVKLLTSLFTESSASLFYEGVLPDKRKIRAAEFLELRDGKIVRSTAIISGPMVAS